MSVPSKREKEDARPKQKRAWGEQEGKSLSVFSAEGAKVHLDEPVCPVL